MVFVLSEKTALTLRILNLIVLYLTTYTIIKKKNYGMRPKKMFDCNNIKLWHFQFDLIIIFQFNFFSSSSNHLYPYICSKKEIFSFLQRTKNVEICKCARKKGWFAYMRKSFSTFFSSTQTLVVSHFVFLSMCQMRANVLWLRWQ